MSLENRGTLAGLSASLANFLSAFRFFFFLFLSFLFQFSPAGASDQFGGFRDYVDGPSLKPFTRDLGGVLGSATFHSGRNLGFPGFDVGVHGGMQFRPDKNNKALRDAGVRAFGLPWVQAEIGLPFGIDGYIRGISYQGLTIAGGGLRYGFLKSSEKPWKPQLLLSSVGHSVTHRDFSASHFGLNLVVSMGTPAVSPYVGAGFDRTRVVVRDSRFDPALNETAVITLEPRFTTGISLRPKTFTYLQGAFTLAHGQPGIDMGLGIRF
ncbi:MAG: hypothetical protein HY551_06525 [Elusimicrobia bacterium]|nr:hypothetical protein [Elusimicrobiota bacterium]